MSTGQRLLVKVTRESLPQISDKYPFLYLERGRLEVDESSVKWIDSDGQVIALPIATINTLLLGPYVMQRQASGYRIITIGSSRKPQVLISGLQLIVETLNS